MYDIRSDIDFRDYKDSRSPFQRDREWIINGKKRRDSRSNAGCAAIIGEREKRSQDLLAMHCFGAKEL